MGLLIRQGKHKEEEILQTGDKSTRAKVTKIKLHPKKNDAIIVTFQVIEGQYKGKTFTDMIFFDPEHPASFKYKDLRKAAQVPYDKNEPENIDIEDLLLNKVVTVKLGVRQHEGREYQDVNYLVAEKATKKKEEVKDEVDWSEEAVVDDEDDIDDIELEDDDPF